MQAMFSGPPLAARQRDIHTSIRVAPIRLWLEQRNVGLAPPCSQPQQKVTWESLVSLPQLVNLSSRCGRTTMPAKNFVRYQSRILTGLASFDGTARPCCFGFVGICLLIFGPLLFLLGKRLPVFLPWPSGRHSTESAGIYDQAPQRIGGLKR
jgi:hypothetical protein